MSYKFAKVMFKIGWGLMIVGGISLVASIIWFFILPLPITDPKIIGVITTTMPLGIGGIILIGGVLVYFALTDMASCNKDTKSDNKINE